MTEAIRVGLISDTHGVLPTSVYRVFAGVSRILHAGDIGSAKILDDLGRIAPVTAVRGNIDVASELAMRLPSFSVTDVGGIRFALTHIKGRAISVEDARSRGCDFYVFGHTHISEVVEDDGLWVVNPGSPSRARSGSGRSVAIVEASDGEVLSVEVVSLD